MSDFEFLMSSIRTEADKDKKQDKRLRCYVFIGSVCIILCALLFMTNAFVGVNYKPYFIGATLILESVLIMCLILIVVRATKMVKDIKDMEDKG